MHGDNAFLIFDECRNNGIIFYCIGNYIMSTLYEDKSIGLILISL